MAVYKRTYRRYEGALTPEWSRFMVPMRFAFEDLYRSRILAMLLLGSAIVPASAAFIIYLRHSAAAALLVGTNASRMLAINEEFFMTILGWQSMLCFFVTAFVGPGLVSPDLANNALPLYLSRPFSRTEYVLGKLSVLLTLQSAMTWVPGLLLVALEGYLEGNGWLGANLHIVSGLFLGSWIWMLVLSMLALALSAWVKWKPVAGALLFGVFFVMGGFAAAINGILRTRWGNLLNISHLIGAVWVSLFERPIRRGAGAVFFRVSRAEEIPIWACWLALSAILVACLWLLNRRIRGVEVVS
ncbi:MAG: ABC transporter permease [Bryobacteraceae bacterium]